jgi:uncharacterized protein
VRVYIFHPHSRGIAILNREEVIDQTARHVKTLLLREGSGHDWWHVYRVWKTAVTIGQAEQVDLFVVALAALLHDVADWKFRDGDDAAGGRAAREWLARLGIEDPVILHVCRIITDLSFKGAGVSTPMESREGMVVQDADRLDALGAIGIARAFAYGGHRGQQIHDPELPPKQHATFEEYKRSTSTSINHFYEKLLLLKGRMNTDMGKTIAEERHAFLVQFLERFFHEWEGRA